MEHFQEVVAFQKPSDVNELMPCKLDWKMKTCFIDSLWVFCSSRPKDELYYQRKISPMMAAAAYCDQSYQEIVKDKFNSILDKKLSKYCTCLIQFWAPIKVNGSTFLSAADQPFALCMRLDKGLCSYRRRCLDTFIPIDINSDEVLGPLGRVFRSGLPEFNFDMESYSAKEFPMLENAIRLGIRSYCAIPVLKIHEQLCVDVLEFVGVLEFASTHLPFSYYIPDLIEGLELRSSELHTLCCTQRFLQLSELYDDAGLGQMETALDVICTTHSLSFAQIWILDPTQSTSINALISAGTKSYDSSSTMYGEFADASSFSYIQTGKGVVGRAFSSQGSCFCKDVTLLSLTEYPLVPTARKARLTHCFAICLKSTRADKLVYVVEYFLPPREMVDRDAEIFLNMILSTMKEQLPGVIVASGKELGQRMLVEVLKVSPCDELDSFEIGQPLLSVQSLQDGGETTEIYSLCQRSNIHDWEDNLSSGLLVPSCSSRRLDSFNDEGQAQVDLLLEHPTEAAITNRGRVDVDVAHDHIEIEKDTSEIMELESHFEQENIETDSTGSARSNDKVEHSDIARCGRQLVEAECLNGESNWVSGATTNIQRIDSQKNSTKQRIVKDYGITRKILEEHFGMYRKDAAKSLRVSVPTFKRICREYNISRWPHPKTRKVYPHVSQGVSLHGVEPNVGDQQCPNLSQEKGTDNSAHERSTATGKPSDSVMTVKVTHRDDMIKFKLTPSSTRVELEGILKKKLNISLQRFSIKYQDEENDWVTITEDADLREGMHELRLLGRTTMKLLLTPKSDT